MLLFNVVTRVLLSFIVRISIHPMLLFNTSKVFYSFLLFLISIHPMLLFNAMGICKELAAVCYFNTSHVIIQQRKIILKKSEEQISIHPMLLFSFHPYIRCTVIFEFQYILCYYSANEKPSFLHLTDLYKSRS